MFLITKNKKLGEVQDIMYEDLFDYNNNNNILNSNVSVIHSTLFSEEKLIIYANDIRLT